MYPSRTFCNLTIQLTLQVISLIYEVKEFIQNIEFVDRVNDDYKYINIEQQEIELHEPNHSNNNHNINTNTNTNDNLNNLNNNNNNLNNNLNKLQNEQQQQQQQQIMNPLHSKQQDDML